MNKFYDSLSSIVLTNTVSKFEEAIINTKQILKQKKRKNAKKLNESCQFTIEYPSINDIRSEQLLPFSSEVKVDYIKHLEERNKRISNENLPQSAHTKQKVSEFLKRKLSDDDLKIVYNKDYIQSTQKKQKILDYDFNPLKLPTILKLNFVNTNYFQNERISSDNGSTLSLMQSNKSYATINKSEESLHLCFYCDNKFKNKNDLCNHIRIHKASLTYKCNHCGYTTTIQIFFKKHMKTHKHMETSISN